MFKTLTVCAILALSFIEAKTDLKNNLVSFADITTDSDSTDSTDIKTDTTTNSTDIVPEKDDDEDDR